MEKTGGRIAITFIILIAAVVLTLFNSIGIMTEYTKFDCGQANAAEARSPLYNDIGIMTEYTKFDCGQANAAEARSPFYNNIGIMTEYTKFDCGQANAAGARSPLYNDIGIMTEYTKFDCGQANAAEARSPLSAETAALYEIIKSPATVTLVYDSVSYKYSDTFIEPTDFTVKEEFERRKINAPVAEKTEMVYKLISGGASVKDAMLYCFPRLADVVNKAVLEIKASPKNSEIRFYPNKRPMFEISRSVPGYKLDENRVYSDVLYALAKGLKRVSLVPDIIHPEVHESQLTKLTHLRASYSTYFTSSGPERKHNIKLSMSKISGLRLNKGETFSFNNVVGARTTKNGFMESIIIVNGKYVKGVGGGVCQASTAVYNGALLAGMKIVSVSNHSLTPSYVPPSFDAMVNATRSDLKFSNPFDEPVFIRTICTDDRATVEFYSSKLAYKIKTESVVLNKGEIPTAEEFIDNDYKYTEGMTPGTRVWVSGGSAPLKSEGYLIYEYDNGQTKKIKIRTDTYVGAAPQYAVAPGEPATAEEADLARQPA